MSADAASLAAGLPETTSHLAAGAAVLAAKCEPWNLICKGGEVIGGLAGKAGASIVDQVAQAFAKASIELLKVLMTWWVKVPSPGIDDNDPSDPVWFMQEYTGWIVTWVAVLGLLISAGRIAWQRRGEAFREAFSGLVTMVVAVFAGVAAVNLAVAAGDSYSNWILNAATNGDVKGLLGKGAVLYGGAIFPTMSAVILIVALLAILSSVVQLGMMLVRSAMLVLLAGALPLAAGAAITPDGRQWFKKMVGWLIAFVLYKPVAATIYAVAFKCLMGDSMSQLQGLILIILAVIALPALMRFIVPMVSAAGGSAGGGMAGAAMGAAAMGARMVPSMGGGGGGGGSSGGGSGGGSGGSSNPAGAKTAGGQGSPGGQGDPGKDGSQGPAGPQGGQGSQPGGGGAPTPTPASGGTTGGASATQAGSAAGPWGAVAGAVVDAGKKVGDAVKGAASDATGDKEGPDGSR